MARLIHASGELSVKVVYYGPGGSGKTTNLVQAHHLADPERRTALVGLGDEAERTLHFEYFGSDLGTVGRFRVRAQFYTVPGQAYTRETRRLVLRGADGVVFVADSDPARLDANADAVDDLRQALAAHGQVLEEMPIVFQWNKRDLPNAVAASALSAVLNPTGAAEMEAVAVRGDGVLATRDHILTRVFSGLTQRLSGVARG